jgi:ADP-heptose:LPS heptosyltransferase
MASCGLPRTHTTHHQSEQIETNRSLLLLSAVLSPKVAVARPSFGDCIMATSASKGHLGAYGRKVAFGDGRYVEWSEVFIGNPNIAHPVEVARGLPVDWIDNFAGRRPYINHLTSSHERHYYVQWNTTPGELYFTSEEMQFAHNAAKELSFCPYIVIGPHTKNDCGGNKNWYIDRWEQVVASIDLPVVQIGLPGQKILPGAIHIRTPTFRAAAAVISLSAAYLGTEGALHHAAGALGIPAVVIFGGFIHPRNTGYVFHRNIVKTDEPCGRRNFCAHCRAAMTAITVDEVVAELGRILPGAVRGQPQLSGTYPSNWRERNVFDLRREVANALPAGDFSTVIACGEEIRRRGASAPRELVLLAAAYSAAGASSKAERIIRAIQHGGNSQLQAKRLLVTVKQQQSDHRAAAKLAVECVRAGMDQPFLYLQTGRALEMSGYPGEALPFFQAAAANASSTLEMQAEYGRLLFLHGRFKEASPFILARAGSDHLVHYCSIATDIPWWRPDCGVGSRLLIWPLDLGLGSQVLFSTIYEDLRELYPNLIVACDSRLLPLLSNALPKVRFVSELEAVALVADSMIDARATPLCMLPFVRPSPRAFRPVHQLFQRRTEARFLRTKYLRDSDSLLVGLSWFGGIADHDQKRRSVPLVEWDRVFRVKNVKFLSLQFDQRRRGHLRYGDGFSVTDDIEEARLKFGADIIVDDEDDDTGVEHLVTQIAACDLVVSVDNSTAAFAGAVGTRTLLLTSSSPAWPLQLRGTKSLWFESIELLRQNSSRSWKRVMTEAATRISAASNAIAT